MEVIGARRKTIDGINNQVEVVQEGKTRPDGPCGRFEDCPKLFQGYRFTSEPSRGAPAKNDLFDGVGGTRAEARDNIGWSRFVSTGLSTRTPCRDFLRGLQRRCLVDFP